MSVRSQKCKQFFHYKTLTKKLLVLSNIFHQFIQFIAPDKTVSKENIQ